MSYCGDTNFPRNIEVFYEIPKDEFSGLIGVSTHPIKDRLCNWIGVFFADQNIVIDVRIEDIIIKDKNLILKKSIYKYIVEDNLSDNKTIEKLKNETDLPEEVLEKQIFLFKKKELELLNITFKGKSSEYFINTKFKEVKNLMI